LKQLPGQHFRYRKRRRKYVAYFKHRIRISKAQRKLPLNPSIKPEVPKIIPNGHCLK